MTSVVYPAALPGPHAVNVRTAERRHLSPSGQGPWTAASAQRDRDAVVELRFALTAAQWAVWHAWWRDTLDWGGAWFTAARWPLPWGTGGVFAFDSAPRVEPLADMRNVAITALVRGAGAPPFDYEAA